MCRFFLWDGRSYGDSFITSCKVNEEVVRSVREGSIFQIRVYSVLSQNPPLVFLRDFKVIDCVSYILKTPLSLQTMPRPITLTSFEAYISSVRRLSMLPTSRLNLPPPLPSSSSIKRDVSSLSDDRSSRLAISSNSISANSLSYEDKRL